MNFKTINPEDAHNLYPGLIEIDRTGNIFNAVIINTPAGTFRVRQSGYSMTLERHEVVTKFFGHKLVITGKGYVDVELKQYEDKEENLKRTKEMASQLGLEESQYQIAEVIKEVE